MIFLCVLVSVTAFAVGGIPFGYLVGRIVLKDDIRKFGSGNIGATNVGRVLGWKWGIGVLFLDALKGLLPVLLTDRLLEAAGQQDPAGYCRLAAGLAAVTGHMYPVWLRLRGGKGVATALGVVAMVSPFCSGIALLCFVGTLLLSRMVSMSSIIASLAFALSHVLRTGGAAWTATGLPLTVFSFLIPGLIIWRHRSNIRRILDGTENRIMSNQKTENRNGSAGA
jgi:glycerol-3-phosphate acyltransferase PlsY